MMLCVHGSPLYQWDRNRQLRIDSVDIDSEFEIHCAYTDDSNALVVEPKMEGDTLLANIPNILLQRSGYLQVYVVIEGDTIYDQTFYVIARQKPDDYVYTETEVLSYKALSQRMDDFEKNGVSKEKLSEAINEYLSEHPVSESDPNVPDWAKQPEKPTYTAKEVGALSQDELRNGVNLALQQAKESGEFDGDDYVLTERDKQDIADKVPKPEVDLSGYATEKYVDDAIANMGIPEVGGGIPIPATAEVGQTVVVKSVDENGKPVEWEAADLPMGGGSKGWKYLRTVIIPEDITADTSGVAFTALNNGGVVYAFDKDEDGNPFELTELYYSFVASTTNASMFERIYLHPTSKIPGVKAWNLVMALYAYVGKTGEQNRVGWGTGKIVGDKFVSYGAYNGGGTVAPLRGLRELDTAKARKITAIDISNGTTQNGFEVGSKFVFYGR